MCQSNMISRSVEREPLTEPRAAFHHQAADGQLRALVVTNHRCEAAVRDLR
jgi:hypothetical protein